MKSQCCNADIEEDKGGVGVFSLTTGALICSACKKYCVRKKDWIGNKKSTEKDITKRKNKSRAKP